jgi:hypothetical protein
MSAVAELLNRVFRAPGASTRARDPACVRAAAHSRFGRSSSKFHLISKKYLNATVRSEPSKVYRVGFIGLKTGNWHVHCYHKLKPAVVRVG